MSVTLNDIAAQAGVSVSTVSRVLSGKAERYRISESTCVVIKRTAKELNYRPNHLARGLRLNKTNTIGLIAPDVSNPFFAAIIKRVQNVAHGLGYSLFVCNTDENLELEIEHVNLLLKNRVDGLIAMPVGQSYAHFAEWQEKRLPLVLLDRCFDDFAAHSVVVDNYSGAYGAVEHLIEHGHKRIGMIQGLPGTYTNTERLRGYRDALRDHGLEVDESLIVGSDFREENGYVETKLLLNREDPPTALFATSDLITLGVLQVLDEENLRIPDDISVLTFDDFDFAPYLACPLTAVRQPKSMMGEMAVKLLMGHLQNGEHEARRIVLKTRLFMRASVAPPPVHGLRQSPPLLLRSTPVRDARPR